MTNNIDKLIEYSHYEPNKQISVSVFAHQKEILDKLTSIYDSRSEIIRIALDFWLSNEYTQAVIKNKERISELVIEHTKKLNNVLSKCAI